MKLQTGKKSRRASRAARTGSPVSKQSQSKALEAGAELLVEVKETILTREVGSLRVLRGETEVEVGSDREWKANSKLFGGSSRLSKGKGRRLLWTDSDASIPPAEERSGQCKFKYHLPRVDATQSHLLLKYNC